MLVQMFLERLVSDESHPADRAVVFDSFVYLSLGKQIESIERLERESTYCLSESRLSKEGNSLPILQSLLA